MDSASTNSSFFVVCLMWQLWCCQVSRQWFDCCLHRCFLIALNYIAVPFLLLNELYNTFQVISEEFPEFHNLLTLLLEKCDLSDNFQMLANFLQHSPDLEKLTLGRCKVYCTFDIEHLILTNSLVQYRTFSVMWTVLKRSQEKERKSQIEQGVSEPV